MVNPTGGFTISLRDMKEEYVMDISTNQLKTVTLEGVTPAKVAAVEIEKSVTVETSDAIHESIKSEQGTTREKVQEAVSQINDHVQNLQRSLQFTVDEASGKDVVTVLDKTTDEVIRQYPTEDVLAIARHLSEHKDDTVSVLFNSIA